MAETAPLPDALTAGRAARLVGGVTPRTVRRWMRHGVRGPGGKTVKLACRRVGGKWLTCRAWLDAFLAGLNEGTEPLTRSPSQRRRAVAAADREFEAILAGRTC